MSYRRITVLGASGFVGRSIVKRLAAQGAVIAAVGRQVSAAGFLRPMGDVGQIALIDADVTSDSMLADCLAGADVVVNTIGVLYERGTQRFDALHHRLPERIGRLAKAAGIKQVLHISAIGADAQSPASYGRSKAAGEAALRREFPSAIILRPSVVFGPDDSFFNRFGALAMMLPALPLFGGGATRFQPVYVGDVAEAAAVSLAREDAAGRIFELGGPQIFTYRQLMELLLHEIRRRRLLVPVPFGLAAIPAALFGILPKPPLTRDQLRLLRRDNVVAAGAPGLAELGIDPTAVELVLPLYLDRFRRGGRKQINPPPIVITTS